MWLLLLLSITFYCPLVRCTLCPPSSELELHPIQLVSLSAMKSCKRGSVCRSTASHDTRYTSSRSIHMHLARRAEANTKLFGPAAVCSVYAAGDLHHDGKSFCRQQLRFLVPRYVNGRLHNDFSKRTTRLTCFSRLSVVIFFLYPPGSRIIACPQAKRASGRTYALKVLSLHSTPPS